MATKRVRYTTTRKYKKTRYVPKTKYRAKKGRGRTYRKAVAPGFKTKKIAKRFPKKKKIVKLNSRVRNLERKVGNTVSQHHRVTIRDYNLTMPSNHVGYSQIARNDVAQLRGLLTAVPQRNIPDAAITNLAVANAPESKLWVKTVSTTMIKNPSALPAKVRVYFLQPKEPTSKSPLQYLQDINDWYGGYYNLTTATDHEPPITSGGYQSRFWYPSENPALTEEWKILSTKDYYLKSNAERNIRYSKKHRIKLMDVDEVADSQYDPDNGAVFMLIRAMGVHGVGFAGGVDYSQFDTVQGNIKIEDELHQWVYWEGGTVPVKTKEVIVSGNLTLDDEGFLPQVTKTFQDFSTDFIPPVPHP